MKKYLVKIKHSYIFLLFPAVFFIHSEVAQAGLVNDVFNTPTKSYVDAILTKN